MVRWLLVVLAVTGCDKVFGFNDVPAASIDAPLDASMPGTWREVAAGASHTCAIRMDDTLWCWGRNDDGQLGMGSAAPRELDVPTVVAGTWKHVATMDRTTCAIDSSGALYCWGLSGNGQAGIVQGIVRTPNLVDVGPWSEVSTGSTFSCGLTSDGHVKCWGLNTSGELGAGDLMSSPTPRPLDSALLFTHLDLGASHGCAIATDQSLWCWGDGYWGQLGQGNGMSHPTPVQVGTDAWLDVSAGDKATCGVLATGHLRCWGTGYADELGNTVTIQELRPAVVGTDSDGWVHIEMAFAHACAQRNDGSVWCWGENDSLQLANINLPAKDPVPTAIPGGPASWLEVATGADHFCGIGDDHALWCIGLTLDGALGNGKGSLTVPVKVMAAATQLVAGYSSTCAVDPMNQRMCWGDNYYAQLGDGTNRAYDVPTPIGSGGLQLVIGIYDTCVLDGTGHLQCAGGSYNYEIDPNNAAHPTRVEVSAMYAPYMQATLTTHGCAITSTGALYCWGYGVNGELGDGLSVTEMAPTPVGSDTWSQVAAADNHTCGISTTGVECWGYGPYGEIGDGSNVDRPSPTPVMTTATTGTIYAAGGGSCLLLADGSLSCWGYNDRNQLGTGAASNSVPKPVTGTYSEVALGRAHSCAVALDHSLWCWGDNTFGGLGNGTLIDAKTPVQSSTASWLHVTVGDYHSCGVQTDGSVWCWGADRSGQAGVPRVQDNFFRLP